MGIRLQMILSMSSMRSGPDLSPRLAPIQQSPASLFRLEVDLDAADNKPCAFDVAGVCSRTSRTKRGGAPSSITSPRMAAHRRRSVLSQAQMPVNLRISSFPCALMSHKTSSAHRAALGQRRVSRIAQGETIIAPFGFPPATRPNAGAFCLSNTWAAHGVKDKHLEAPSLGD